MVRHPCHSDFRFIHSFTTYLSASSLPILDFSSQELGRLSHAKIVPVQDKGEGNLRWHPPAQCYFGGDAKGEFHSKLFVFINFGQPANGFLSACGTKHQPSVEEVALTLLRDPRRFYASAEGPTR